MPVKTAIRFVTLGNRHSNERRRTECRVFHEEGDASRLRGLKHLRRFRAADQPTPRRIDSSDIAAI